MSMIGTCLSQIRRGQNEYPLRTHHTADVASIV